MGNNVKKNSKRSVVSFLEDTPTSLGYAHLLEQCFIFQIMIKKLMGWLKKLTRTGLISYIRVHALLELGLCNFMSHGEILSVISLFLKKYGDQKLNWYFKKYINKVFYDDSFDCHAYCFLD